MRARSSMSRLAASQRTRRVSSAAITVARASSAASRDDASCAQPMGTAASVSTPPCPQSRPVMGSILHYAAWPAGPCGRR